MLPSVIRRMSTVGPSQIKTLSQLYREGRLSGSKGETAYKPNDEINSKVSLWCAGLSAKSSFAIASKHAIHRAAGNELYDACAKLNGCQTGNTKITDGFKLPSKHILHTVGPVYSASRKSECEQQLESCYRTTLHAAMDNKVKTVALCGVSTGIYGFPLEAATKIALGTVRKVLDDKIDKFDRIIFCNFGSKDVEVYERLAVGQPRHTVLQYVQLI